MEKDMWAKLQPLIDEGLDLGPDERTAWISRIREESPTIADELERLISREGTLDRRGFLRTPPAIDSLVDRVLAGETIGFQRTDLEAALSPRYTLGPVVGRGGMATVYRARDTRHERDVAIKVIRPDAASALGAERFLAEIRLTANLTHPNILPLLDSGESAGVLYYVMPFIDGESLRARVRREGALPVDDVVRILRSVTEALAHAHAKGAVHRDIKPDNILIAGRQLWVADFGIAKAVANSSATSDATAAGVVLGSPGYMAPEQIEGSAAADHRADIYSMGATGWELLAGRPVFDGGTMQQLFAQHLTIVPAPIEEVRSDVPPVLADVVMRSLAKSPADRWASADAILEQLDAAMAGSGAFVPVAPTARRGRIAIGVGLALTAAVALWAVQTRGSVETPQARALTTTGDVAMPRLSPDERTIVFRRRTDASAVWFQRVDSANATRLASGVPGSAGWLDDSTVVVLSPQGKASFLLLPDGRPASFSWAADSSGRWFSAGPGVLYHARRLTDSGAITLRRALAAGWRDSVTVRPDVGEQALWFAGSMHSSRLVMGTRMTDSSLRITTVKPDGAREVLQTIPRRDSAGFNARLARGPAMTRDGRFLDFWFPPRDSLIRVSTADRDVPPMVLAGDIPGVMWDQTSHGQVLVARLSESISTWRFPIPVDTGRRARIIERATDGVLSASLSPDTLLMARVEGARAGRVELTVSGATGGARKRLLSAMGNIYGLRWSPDGNRLALRVVERGRAARWIVVDVRDGSVVRLGREPIAHSLPYSAAGYPPAWSPDGRWLFVVDVDSVPKDRVRQFSVAVQGDTGVLVSNMWEGDEKPAPGRHDRFPEGIAVSPDGNYLAVGGSELTVIPAGGGPAREIVAHNKVDLIIPFVWLPDGEIMYATLDERTRRTGTAPSLRDIWLVRASGGQPRHVGVLPSPCNFQFSVLLGGREVTCFINEQLTDAWLVSHPRR